MAKLPPLQARGAIPLFEIETDHADRIIFLRMSGVLSIEEGHACAAAKEAAVESLGPPYEAHSTLVDICDLRLQSQEVFAIFTNFVATTKYKSRRIAIVGGEGTARMQFRRVSERTPLRDDMRLFSLVGEARNWLVDEARAFAASSHASLAKPILAGRPSAATGRSLF